jgi:iron uptake system component EfeO
MLIIPALAACGHSEDPAAGSVTIKTEKPAKNKGDQDEVKQGAVKMKEITAHLQEVLEQKNTEKIKSLGKKLNDHWLSFENGVRDRFPLLYTKVEKYEQPIFAQSTLEKPNLMEMKEQANGLQAALDQLKNAKESNRQTSEVLKKAVKQYHDYVVDQTDHLVATTKGFVEAVKSGDLKKAKALYPEARVYYERIEPVAESFGDLDPKIDARINDVDDKSNWTGFHRLEKALWKDQSLDGQKKYADQLLKDVKHLQRKVENIDLQPDQVVAGSMELLNEAAISKITGEEERYSHLDLVDLAANVEGSEAVYHAIVPALQGNNKQLADKLDKRFRTIHKTLQNDRKNDQYVSYDKLNKDEIRELSHKLSQLSELMAQTANIF